MSTEQEIKDKLRKKKYRKYFTLTRYIYLEKESLFIVPETLNMSEGKKAVRLGRIQHATGVISGTVQNYDSETKSGTIEIEGKIFPFTFTGNDKKEKKLKETIGQHTQFAFWPTSDKISAKEPYLKIINVFHKEVPFPGYTEVIGKLEKMWDGGFAIRLRSMIADKKFYVIFSGNYPFPEQIKRYMWIIAKFDPIQDTILLQESNQIVFVSKEEMISFKEKSRLISEEKPEQASKDKSKLIEDLWQEIKKETNRTMVNAKLKIVLKEKPLSLKEANGKICIPLINEAKSIPGSMTLENTPIDLFLTKKMWNKAEKIATEKQQNTGKPAIYVIEALIGVKDNRLIATASGVQVMEGKDKDKNKDKEAKKNIETKE